MVYVYPYPTTGGVDSGQQRCPPVYYLAVYPHDWVASLMLLIIILIFVNAILLCGPRYTEMTVVRLNSPSKMSGSRALPRPAGTAFRERPQCGHIHATVTVLFEQTYQSTCTANSWIQTRKPSLEVTSISLAQRTSTRNELHCAICTFGAALWWLQMYTFPNVHPQPQKGHFI